MDSIDKVELTVAEKLAQMEKEKLTRRQALARFGFQAGAAAVAALTADDLLRKVGTEMQRRAGDNKVAKQVATELQNAGVANAAVTGVPPGQPCSSATNAADCFACCRSRNPSSSDPYDIGYNWCLTWSDCRNW